MTDSYELDFSMSQPTIDAGRLTVALVDLTKSTVLYEDTENASVDSAFPLQMTSHFTLPRSTSCLISSKLGIEFPIAMAEANPKQTGVVIHQGTVPNYNTDPASYSYNSESCLVANRSLFMSLQAEIEAVAGLPSDPPGTVSHNPQVATWIKQNCQVTLNASIGLPQPKLIINNRNSLSASFSLTHPVEKNVLVLYGIYGAHNTLLSTREAEISGGHTNSSKIDLGQITDYAPSSDFKTMPTWSDPNAMSAFDNPVDPGNVAKSISGSVRILGYAVQFHDGTWYWDSKSSPQSTDLSNENLMYNGQTSSRRSVLSASVPSDGSPENPAQGRTPFTYSLSGPEQTIASFVASGVDHDILSLSGSDFRDSIADVLRNTVDTNFGAEVADPTSGSTVILSGVTKAELKAHGADLSFRA